MSGVEKKHHDIPERKDPKDRPDYYPTTPWITRALFEHVLGPPWPRGCNVWEPACGAGHMSKVLAEYMDDVRSTDLYDRGWEGGISGIDFLDPETEMPGGGRPDWIITNPPFALAEEFIAAALDKTGGGVAMFGRLAWVESITRYEKIWNVNPPEQVAIFTQRASLAKNRNAPSLPAGIPFAWYVWRPEYTEPGHTRLTWIPPCKKELEMPWDYEDA